MEKLGSSRKPICCGSFEGAAPNVLVTLSPGKAAGAPQGTSRPTRVTISHVAYGINGGVQSKAPEVGRNDLPGGPARRPGTSGGGVGHCHSATGRAKCGPARGSRDSSLEGEMPAKTRYSIFSLVRNALSYHEN